MRRTIDITRGRSDPGGHRSMRCAIYSVDGGMYMFIVKKAALRYLMSPPPNEIHIYTSTLRELRAQREQQSKQYCRCTGVRHASSAIAKLSGISGTLPFCAESAVHTSAPIYRTMPRGTETPPKQSTVCICVAGGQLGRRINVKLIKGIKYQVCHISIEVTACCGIHRV